MTRSHRYDHLPERNVGTIRISALNGPRSLANPFVFQSPVGTAKITAEFTGNLTLNYNGRSQLVSSPASSSLQAARVAFTSTHILEGAAGLIKNGTGTLRLEAANEYVGDTDLVQGVLQAGNDQALGKRRPTDFQRRNQDRTLASFGGARTLTNQVLLNAPTFGLDGTLGLLPLNLTPLSAPRLSLARAPRTFGHGGFSVRTST